MSQFNQKIKTAKKKQRLLYLSYITLFLVISIIIISIVFVSRGTRIEIEPAEARQNASLKINEGIAFIIGKTVYSISRSPTILASANGFKPKKQTLNKYDFGKSITITLKPLPAKIELNTNIEPDKTDKISWLVNGIIKKISSNIFKYEMEHGKYEITVLHPYYQKKVVTLSLAKGESLKKMINLNPIDGSININSTPEGASLLINNKHIGKTPLLKPLLGGEYKLTLSLPNYAIIEDNIEINHTDPTVDRNYRFKPKEIIIPITLIPEKGALFVNGIAVKAKNKLAIKAGVENDITYKKDGYITESKTFKSSENKNSSLVFKLKKEIVKENHQNIKKLITPNASSDKETNIKLILENTVTTPLKQYQNKAGITLKLFTPNEVYEMGSKQDDLERRANETIKNVKLTKAFYASLYEISNAEYKLFDNKNNGFPKKPVTNVSWLKAILYCNWLSEIEDFRPFYNIKDNKLISINAKSNGYRLLTEAEWEWLASKAGRPKKTIFVWGDQKIIPKNAVNIADESAKGLVDFFVSKYNDGVPKVAEVGSFSVEKSGLYDLGGNVSEWTHDGYLTTIQKAKTTLKNPIDITIGNTHVVKGANWHSGTITILRAAYREGMIGARNDIGFRIGRYLY